MHLTFENYHSAEANAHYMGSTQFKQFMECEACAMAMVKGDWKESPSTAMMIGSYVDAHFSGTLDLFKAQNPYIFKKDGDLKSEYIQANVIIERIESDASMMKYLTGEKQVIKTGTIAGVPFKIRIDSYKAGQFICDLKVMRNFESVWKDGQRMNFVEAWGYDYQGAIYRAVEGNDLPFIIAAASGKTSGATPNIALMYIPADVLDDRLSMVQELAQQFQMIKLGLADPIRCERCDYCNSTKVLGEPIDYREVGDE